MYGILSICQVHSAPGIVLGSAVSIYFQFPYGRMGEKTNKKRNMKGGEEKERKERDLDTVSSYAGMYLESEIMSAHMTRQENGLEYHVLERN